MTEAEEYKLKTKNRIKEGRVSSRASSRFIEDVILKLSLKRAKKEKVVKYSFLNKLFAAFIILVSGFFFYQIVEYAIRNINTGVLILSSIIFLIIITLVSIWLIRSILKNNFLSYLFVTSVSITYLVAVLSTGETISENIFPILITLSGIFLMKNFFTFKNKKIVYNIYREENKKS
ncbi:MAG: hypothetical protein ACPGTS_00690 [Minisyncoccia bacterium]